MKRSLLVAGLVFSASGCGDSGGGSGSKQLPAVAAPGAAPAPGPAAAPAPGAAAAPSPAVPGAAGPGPAQAPVAGQAPAESMEAAKEQLLADVRTRKFKNEDFVESESNRDPFHSYLMDFSSGIELSKTPQYEILLSKFSLDELKLAMVVGPPTQTVGSRVVRKEGARYVEPRAMFVDPTGMGVSVVRGKHLSKADAKVIRIEPDKGKVFVEIKEDLGGGKSRMVERVLELHQGEPMAEGRP